MTNQLRTLIAAGYCFLTIPLALAGGASSDHGFREFQVGRTGIFCYQEPCPWNGITRADKPVRPHTLLWSGDTLPPMRGSAEARAHLLENYREHCTLINGRFQDGVLEVARILGPC